MKNEKVIEIKTCKHCSFSFDITDKDLEFYEKVSPNFWWKKYFIPTPTLCPDCRQQRRLTWRNERKLYKRKCDATGEDIISIYSPEKSYKVYNQEFWWSDKWTALDYWREFDFTRSFFEQFGNMMKKVPQISLFTSNNENSEYTNFSEAEKNCYFLFASNRNEDCYYSSMIWDSFSCMDCFSLEKSQNCYSLVDWANCIRVNFSQKVYNSSFCSYIFDCDWCNYCFWCTWLRNKEYYILNVPLSKEEYKKTINDSKKIASIIEEFEILKQNQIRLYENIKSCENVSWWNLMNCKNCINCFNSFWLEDAKFTENSPWNSSNVYDISWCTGTNLSLELVSIANAYNMLFVWISHLSSSHQIYSLYCHNSSNLFGCIWLRNKQYCILNKQYTKEEYEKLVPKIIEHMMKTWEWGEFFPSSISPFSYNETVAQEYLPIEKEEAIKKWFSRSDYENPFPKVEKIIPASKLPSNISEIPNDILTWAIECEITKKPFRIIAQELDFYRKHNLPIPKRHPDQRHLDRMALRNPRKLFDRKCDKCRKEIQTTYAPEREETVYCEECYGKDIY